MKYYSLNRQAAAVDFRTAVINGQAPDKGLYFPGTIPQLPKNLISDIGRYSNEEIAFEAMAPYVSGEIPDGKLMDIIKKAIDFPMPLVHVNSNVYTLELFHGNTLAFKDLGARFMSRCLAHFVSGNDKKLTVLVATSGDTGGAVADGFSGIDGIEVVILYPSGKVSSVQEKQLTSHGDNVHAIEIEGSFDDCQYLVKKAFMDPDLNRLLSLTSANSINIARWLPQQFFYFFAWKQWPHKQLQPVISVPSGNFGNICAGLLAKQSGLPLNHFIAACNANDVIPKFLQNGSYQAQPSIATISNAMDVGDPSNFVRVLEMFDHRHNRISKVLTAYSISDVETKQAMQIMYKDHGYVADPHGAVGFAALERYNSCNNTSGGIFLETAHPVKFYDVVEPLLATKIALPQQVASIMVKPKKALWMKAAYKEFKEYLLGGA